MLSTPFIVESDKLTSYVAPGCTNALACERLRVCRLNFPVIMEPIGGKSEPKPSSEKKDSRTVFQQFIDGMTAEPLQDAYLVFLPITPVSDPTQSNISKSGHILARTNKDGEVLLIERGQIDGPVPSSEPSNWLWAKGGDYYRWFWTFSKDLFKRAIDQASADPSRAAGAFGFDSIQITLEIPPVTPMDSRYTKFEPFVELLGKQQGRHGDSYKPFAQEFVLEHSILRRHDGLAWPGYLRGFDINRAVSKQTLYDSASYLIAGSDPIDCVYLCELLHYHAISLYQLTLDRYAIFSQVDAICRAAEEKVRVPQFDESIKEGPFDEEFYEYAYECAIDTRVKPEDFYDSIDDNVAYPSSWKRGIAETRGLGHQAPTHIGSDGDTIERYHTTENQGWVRRYFDFYRFGIDQKNKPWHIWLRYSRQQIAFHLSQVQQSLRQSMAKRAPYGELMRHINLHYDLDPEKRADFHLRYLFVALWLGYPWWQDLDAELKKEQEGGEASAGEGGLPESAKWIAELAEKTGRIFTHYLSDLEVIEQLNRLLESKAEAIEQFLRTLYRFDTRVKSGVIPKILPKASGNLKIDIDFDKGEILIKGDRKLEKAGPFAFITEVKKAEDVDLELKAGENVLKKKMYAKARKTGIVRDIEVEAPLRRPMGWPPWLEAVGALFAFAFDVVNLSKELKEKDGIEVWANFVHDGLIATDTVANALKTSMTIADKDTAWIKTFAKYGERAKGVALPLQAVINLCEGYTIMYIEDKSPSYAALEKGQIWIGRLEYARGFVLLSSTATGLGLGAWAALAAESAAFAAFLGPLGVALLIGGVTAILISVAVIALTGPNSTMKEMQEELETAVDKEFGKTGNRGGAGETPNSLDRFRRAMNKVLQNLSNAAVAQ